jgi:circadian clock protein KaiC
LIRGGERNRALTIIKSRGTHHSNQVRELILSDAGPMLADVYTAGGEVLMGTLRWEREDDERVKTMQRRSEFEQKRVSLELAESNTRARIEALEHDLERQRIELAAYFSDDEARIVSSGDREKLLLRIRGGDPAGRPAMGTVAPLEKRLGSNGSGKSARKHKTEARDGS